MNKDVPLIYEFDGYLFDEINRMFFYRDVEIHLTKRNFDVLQLFIKKNGSLVSKEEFFETVWADTNVEDGNLAVSIAGLRKIFESNTNTVYIKTIPRRGYIFTANVKQIHETNPKPNQTVNELKQKVIKSVKLPRVLSTRKPRLISVALLTGLILTLIGVGTAFYYSNIKQPGVKSSELKKIAIFPFENITQVQEEDFLSLAFADSLNNSLLFIPNISVTSTSQIKQYYNKSYNPIEEGKKLGVNTVVTGSYHKSADNLIINVVLTDISVPNPVVRQAQFIKATNELINLRSNVVKFITDSLNIKVSVKDSAALKKLETQNPEAYESYLRAVNAHNNTKFDDAVLYYKKSVELDPDFDIASESLAAVYLAQGNVYGCGEPCAFKGVEILNRLHEKDPDNDRVSVNLAQILVELDQAEKGISILKKIVVKDPKNYFAYNALSYAYRHVGLIDESNSAYDNAVVDDQYTVLTDKAFWFSNDARLYQGKYADYIATIDQHENRAANYNRGMAYFYLKDYQKAKNLFTEAYQRLPDVLLFKFGKVYIYYIDKDKPTGLNLLNEIYTSIKVNKMYSGDMIYKAAQAYAVYDQKEKAIELFDLSIEKGFFCYPYFASDPLLENIRKEEGFLINLEKARKRHEAFKQNKNPNKYGLN